MLFKTQLNLIQNDLNTSSPPNTRTSKSSGTKQKETFVSWLWSWVDLFTEGLALGSLRGEKNREKRGNRQKTKPLTYNQPRRVLLPSPRCPEHSSWPGWKVPFGLSRRRTPLRATDSECLLRSKPETMKASNSLKPKALFLNK